MRWLALGLCCLLAAPASAQSWATRGLCLEQEPKIHAEAFAPATYEEIQQLAADIPNGTGRFWRIEGEDGTVSHLWGTLHSNLPHTLELPDPVTTEITAARMVAIENDYTRETRAEIYRRNTESRYFQDDYSHHTSELGLPLDMEDWIRTRFEALGYGHDAYDYLNAGAVAEILLSDPCSEFYQGIYPLQDNRILMLGAIAGAGTMGLEDGNAFYDRLNDPTSLDLATAIIATYGAYLHPDQTPEAYATSDALYLSGRIAEMMAWERAFFDHTYPEGLGLDWLARTDAYMLTERNETFLATALPELEKGGLFMATGAFHLPRDTGMIALLRREGYTVTRIPLSGEAP
ncbi:MAG: TraB/GumN family protein [Roseovarius sp.]